MTFYQGSSLETMLEQQREKMRNEYLRMKEKIIRDNRVNISADKFISKSYSSEDRLKQSTVGLLKLEEFKRRRESAECPDEKTSSQKPKKKKKNDKLKATALSFNVDDDDNESHDTDEPARKKKRLGKNPDVNTSFLPDQEREKEERVIRQQLEEEWRQKQEEIKAQEIEIVVSYYAGVDRLFKIKCRKGDSIGYFLRRCENHITELKNLNTDDILFVKADLVLPHDMTFYDLILSEAWGRSGPLFDFEPKDPSKADTKKYEPFHARIARYDWYERNEYLSPASNWQSYDPKRNYKTREDSTDITSDLTFNKLL